METKHIIYKDFNNKNKEEEELSLIKDLIQPGTDVIDVGVYQGIY